MTSSNTNSYSYDTYLSPFTMRYGSSEMRHIWSEENKRLLWRHIWVSLAKAQNKAGIVSPEELADIIAHEKDLDIEKSKEVEKEIYHELMAEIKVFASQCAIGGGKIHAGATSNDILDNATTIQIHTSLTHIKQQLKNLLSIFKEKIETYQNMVCMGYTHLQPAEPTTMGYRFAFYAQDLLMDLELLEKIEPLIKAKGIKGAVGTSASYQELMPQTSAVDFEKEIMDELGLSSVQITGQIYPRKIDLLVMEILGNIAASLHKFAFDYRILQQPSLGEWIEARDSKRVGSTAMPFKRNPDKAEKVDSLCRYIASLIPLAWTNPANSLLERTLDDSAAQRIFLPECFLALDECLTTVTKLLTNLQINTNAVEKNLQTYGPFAATESVLMALVTKGANRQEMHELIKSLSMQCWQSLSTQNPQSLFDLLQQDTSIQKYLSSEEIKSLEDFSSHIGVTNERTKVFLDQLRLVIP